MISLLVSWVGAFLFVSYFIITDFLILNLIIAVILEKTELSDNQKKRIQKVKIEAFFELAMCEFFVLIYFLQIGDVVLH